MSPRRARLLVATVWILSFVICFPPLVGWKDKRVTIIKCRQFCSLVTRCPSTFLRSFRSLIPRTTWRPHRTDRSTPPPYLSRWNRVPGSASWPTTLATSSTGNREKQRKTTMESRAGVRRVVLKWPRVWNLKRSYPVWMVREGNWGRWGFVKASPARWLERKFSSLESAGLAALEIGITLLVLGARFWNSGEKF